MFGWLFKKTEVAKALKPITGIEFRNVQATKLILWLEPYCIEVELEPITECRIESDGTDYFMEFSCEHITIFLMDRSGPKVLKRPYLPHSATKVPWELDADYLN